jgi:hypothetical protein
MLAKAFHAQIFLDPLAELVRPNGLTVRDNLIVERFVIEFQFTDFPLRGGDSLRRAHGIPLISVQLHTLFCGAGGKSDKRHQQSYDFYHCVHLLDSGVQLTTHQSKGQINQTLCDFFGYAILFHNLIPMLNGRSSQICPEPLLYLRLLIHIPRPWSACRQNTRPRPASSTIMNPSGLSKYAWPGANGISNSFLDSATAASHPVKTGLGASTLGPTPNSFASAAVIGRFPFNGSFGSTAVTNGVSGVFAATTFFLPLGIAFSYAASAGLDGPA